MYKKFFPNNIVQKCQTVAEKTEKFRSCCGIRNWDNYVSEFSPPFESINRQVRDEACRGKGRVDCSATRVPGYPMENPEPVVWPCMRLTRWGTDPKIKDLTFDRIWNRFIRMVKDLNPEIWGYLYGKEKLRMWKRYDVRNSSRAKTEHIQTCYSNKISCSGVATWSTSIHTKTKKSPRIPIYSLILTKPLPFSTPSWRRHKRGQTTGRKNWTIHRPKQKSDQKVEYEFPQHQTYL